MDDKVKVMEVVDTGKATGFCNDRMRKLFTIWDMYSCSKLECTVNTLATNN